MTTVFFKCLVTLYVMKKEREIAIGLLSDFEEYLDKRDITIPSEDRMGEESEARIYGTEYYDLEDTITDLLVDSCSVSSTNDIMDNFRGMLQHAGVDNPKGMFRLRRSVSRTLRREC